MIIARVITRAIKYIVLGAFTIPVAAGIFANVLVATYKDGRKLRVQLDESEVEHFF